jgi:DNA-binding transcriptional ArsR family regulator
MKDGPMIARVAALIGDPARANMLIALTDGRALTASELGHAAGVAPPTASGHLAQLVAGGLVTVEKQGRHRYHRLADADVAQTIEGLMGLAERTGAPRIRTGPREPALRRARICYDHLAGERGVALLAGARAAGFLAGEGELAVTAAGHNAFTRFGVDLDALARGRRPLCRRCLDWSERQSHLGGALGAAVLARLLDQGWARREAGRVLTITPAGVRALATIGLDSADDADNAGR